MASDKMEAEIALWARFMLSMLNKQKIKTISDTCDENFKNNGRPAGQIYQRFICVL